MRQPAALFALLLGATFVGCIGAEEPPSPPTPETCKGWKSRWCAPPPTLTPPCSECPAFVCADGTTPDDSVCPELPRLFGAFTHLHSPVRCDACGAASLATLPDGRLLAAAGDLLVRVADERIEVLAMPPAPMPGATLSDAQWSETRDGAVLSARVTREGATLGFLVADTKDGSRYQSAALLPAAGAGTMRALAAPDDTLHLLFAGPDGALWLASRAPGGEWDAPRALLAPESARAEPGIPRLAHDGRALVPYVIHAAPALIPSPAQPRIGILALDGTVLEERVADGGLLEGTTPSLLATHGGLLLAHVDANGHVAAVRDPPCADNAHCPPPPPQQHAPERILHDDVLTMARTYEAWPPVLDRETRDGTRQQHGFELGRPRDEYAPALLVRDDGHAALAWLEGRGTLVIALER